MTDDRGAPYVKRITHEVPQSIRPRWESGEEIPPEEIQDAFDPTVEQLVEAESSGVDLVPVQGPISSGKSWLLAATARRFQRLGKEVLVLSPQKQNRRELVGRLGSLGADVIECPSNRDLCLWDSWKRSSNRFDHGVCSCNGCPYYPENWDELHEHVLNGLSEHMDDESPVVLSQRELIELAENGVVGNCPKYLIRAIDGCSEFDHAVRVATHQKALPDSLVGDGGGPFDPDVVLVDEAHSLAADTDVVSQSVDTDELVADLNAIADGAKYAEGLESVRYGDSIDDVADALIDWSEESSRKEVSPESLLKRGVGVDDLDETLTDVEEGLQSWLGIGSTPDDEVQAALDAVGRIREFVALLRSYLEGEHEFVHARYEQQGNDLNWLAFRRLQDGRESSDYSGEEVFNHWEKTGTHYAISERWGGFLEEHIKQIWEGYSVSRSEKTSASARVRGPLESLQVTTGADLVCGFSATHNQLSDPKRPVDDPRETAHDIVVVEPNLRTSGKDIQTGGASPSREWFQRSVRQAKNESGANLAAVPINKRNSDRWTNLPVEKLRSEDRLGRGTEISGLVPHSRNAIGNKDYEELEIDAVLAGVQVQSPADTARRLIDLWYLLAPRYQTPAEALEESWRMLAQAALSGTIQAAGRFCSEAPTVLFDLPGLVELAGYEFEQASTETDGFPGAFTRAFEERRDQLREDRSVDGVKKSVDHVMEHNSKSPTISQTTSMYERAFGGPTKLSAEDALERALDRGELQLVRGYLRFPNGA
ncbi:hypothetical protein GRX01_07820 [Halobaculum sp. WSA2]|uniref:Rad3-related DNA helicase n=1 Tax=Halobaculum saliterrae TaxID=2073113 RepID=A0A6B0SX81_9EURY|nr:hypothetical protein [Halobaculum saliterrae]MXR41243.1 hypothetical protein [Halobaculum saliterrae]